MGIIEAGKPERAITFMCKIGADNWQELLNALNQLEFDFATKSEQDIPFSISGGWGWGGVWTVRHDPDMSHDEYFKQLDDYLEAKKMEEGAPHTQTQAPGQTSVAEEKE